MALPTISALVRRLGKGRFLNGKPASIGRGFHSESGFHSGRRGSPLRRNGYRGPRHQPGSGPGRCSVRRILYDHNPPKTVPLFHQYTSLSCRGFSKADAPACRGVALCEDFRDKRGRRGRRHSLGGGQRGRVRKHLGVTGVMAPRGQFSYLAPVFFPFVLYFQ